MKEISNGFNETNVQLLETFVDVFLSTIGSGFALNVPKNMRVGNVDDDGWCEWRAIGSPVKEDDINVIESSLGFTLPTILTRYLTYKCLLMIDAAVRLPQTPYDEPLSEFMEYISLYQDRFKELELFPFAYDANDAGPVCLDLRVLDTNLSPVVIYDYTKADFSDYRGDLVWANIDELFKHMTVELQKYQ